MFHFHHLRRNKFSHGEKRLLCMATSVEVLSGQVVDVLKGAPEQASAKLQALLKQVEAKDQTAFSEAFKNKFDALEENVRKQISENLKNLDVTVLQNVVGTQLDSLKAVVGTPEATDSKEDKKTMYESATESMGKMWEESSVNPQNWSEETTKNMRAAGVGVGIAVAALAAWKIGKWFFVGTKNKVAAVQAKASEGFSILKFLGIGAIVGGLGFLGYKAIESGMKSFAMSQLKDARDQAKQVIDNAQEYTQAQVAAAHRTLERINQGIANSEHSLIITSEQKMVAAEVGGSIAYNALARSIIAFGNTDSWAIEKKSKETILASVMGLSVNRSAVMKDILTAYEGGTLDFSKITIPSGNDSVTQENYEEAVKLLILYCKNNIERLGQVTEDDMNKMTLEEFLNKTAPGYAAMGNAIELFGQNKGNVPEALSKADFIKWIAEDAGFSEYVQDILAEDNLERPNVSELLLALSRYGQLSVDGVLAELKSKPKSERTKTENAVYLLCLRMQREAKGDIEGEKNPAKFILPFFHRFIPNHEWDDKNMQANIAAMQRHWLTEMPVGLAMHLYLYKRLIAKGNPAGFVMMQAEVYKYIYDSDRKQGGWQTRWARLGNRIAAVSAEGTWEEWNEMGVDIDSNLAVDALRKMGDVSEHVLTAGINFLMGSFARSAEGVWGTAEEHPLLVGGSAATIGTGFGVFKYWNWNRSAQPTNVVASLRDIVASRQTNFRVVRGVQGITISKEAAEDALALFSGIMEDSNTIRRFGINGKNALLRQISSQVNDALSECTTALVTRPEAAWDTFISKVQTIRSSMPNDSPTEAVQKLDDIIAHAQSIRGTPGQSSVALDAVYHASRAKLSWARRACRWLTAPFAMLTDGFMHFPAGAFGYLGLGQYALNAVEQASTIADRTARLARYGTLIEEGSNVDTLLRYGATAEDLFELATDAAEKISMDDVMDAIRALGPEDQLRHVRSLLRSSYTADDCVHLFGFALDDVVRAVATMDPNDARRMAIIAGMVADGADNALRRAARKGFSVKELARASTYAFYKRDLPQSWLSDLLFFDAFSTLRSGYADEGLCCFDDAAARLSLMKGITPDEAILLLRDPHVVNILGAFDEVVDASAIAERGATYVDDAFAIALRTAKPGSRVQAVQRVATYMSSLGSELKPQLCSKSVIQFVTNWHRADASFVQNFIMHLKAATDQESTVRVSPKVVQQAKLALTKSDEMIQALTQAERAHVVTTGAGRFAFTLGGEVFAFAMDYMAYQEAKQRVAQSKVKMNELLSPANGFTKTEASGIVTYRHTSGYEVSAAFMDHTLDELDDPEKLRMYVSGVSATLTAAGGVIAYATPTLSLGPVGWVVFGTVVAVHAGSMISQQSSQRDFVTQTPLPVLAYLGLSQTVNVSEFDALAGASNGMVSDIMRTDNKDNKEEIRKRSVSILFWQEIGRLRHEQPDIVEELLTLPSGKQADIIDFMREDGEFFARDYKDIIAPYLAVRMFELSNDGSSTWQDFRQMKIDGGWFDFTNVNEEDMRIALREAALLYVQHIREVRYRSLNEETLALVSVQEAKARETKIENAKQIQELSNATLATATLQSRRDAAGEKMVFGVPAAKLTYATQSDVTRAQAIVLEAQRKLSATDTIEQNYSVSEMGYEYSGPQTVSRPRSAYGSSVFMASIPEGLLPESVARRTPLWTLSYLALSVDREINPEVRKKAFIEKLGAIRSRITPWAIYTEAGLFSSSEARAPITEQNYRDMMQYYELLVRYPEFDEGGKLREILLNGINERGWNTDTVMNRENARVDIEKSVSPYAPRVAYAWQLPFFMAVENPEKSPVVRYDAFQNELFRICNTLYCDKNPNQAYVTPNTQKTFMECFALFSAYPEFDSGGAIRKEIAALPLDDWVTDFPTEVQYGSTVNRMHAILLKKLNALEQQRFIMHKSSAEISPFPLFTYNNSDDAVSTEVKRVGGSVIDNHAAAISTRETYYDWGYRGLEAKSRDIQTSELFLLPAGEVNPVTVKAAECKTVGGVLVTSKAVPHVGLIICESRRHRYPNGREYVTYDWVVKAGQEETSFYVYHKNRAGHEEKGRLFEAVPIPKETDIVDRNSPVVPIPVKHGTLTLRIREGGNIKTISINPTQKEERKKLEPYARLVTSFDKDALTNGGVDYDILEWLVIPVQRSKIESMEFVGLDERESSYTFEPEDTPDFSRLATGRHQEAIKRYDLRKESPFVYLREGYEGLYLMQADGSVLYTGGKGPNDTFIEPMTYANGIWIKNLRHALTAQESRTIVMPGTRINGIESFASSAVTMLFLSSADESAYFVADTPFRLKDGLPDAAEKYFTLETASDGKMTLRQKKGYTGRLIIQEENTGRTIEFAYARLSDNARKEYEERKETDNPWQWGYYSGVVNENGG